MNIVIITCHDLGRFLGCYGVPTVKSPNLDRLAAEGLMFRRAFCTAPQCSPSRSSLFTGRYPHSNGVMGLTHGEFGWDLHPRERHLAHVLRSAGYSTTMIGILHEARDIERCGFDDVVVPGHDARETTRVAVRTLRRLAENGRPFYLQLGYHEPHRVATPGDGRGTSSGFVGDYIAPDDVAGVTIPPYITDEPEARQELAELQGAIRYVDAAIGDVLDEIRVLGLENDTLVVFTTDHGVALPRAKCSLYDPGIEVALLLRLPSLGWIGGKVVSHLVSNVDLFPTVLDAAGISIDGSVHGKSLQPLLDGIADQHRDEIFCEMTYHDYYHPQRAIRTEQFKLIVNFTTAPSFMDPSQSWHRRVRPVIPTDPALAYGPPIELYDLSIDPNEWDNVANSLDYRSTRNELLGRLASWMRDTEDPLLSGAVASPRHTQVVTELNRTLDEMT
jgi:N-sulfoglucosamine sulfohydrolase